MTLILPASSWRVPKRVRQISIFAGITWTVFSAIMIAMNPSDPAWKVLLAAAIVIIPFCSLMGWAFTSPTLEKWTKTRAGKRFFGFLMSFGLVWIVSFVFIVQLTNSPGQDHNIEIISIWIGLAAGCLSWIASSPWWRKSFRQKIQQELDLNFWQYITIRPRHYAFKTQQKWIQFQMWTRPKLATFWLRRYILVTKFWIGINWMKTTIHRCKNWRRKQN